MSGAIWRRVRILELSVFLFVSACSTTSLEHRDAEDPTTAPKQFQPRQIIVTLSNTFQDQWANIDRQIRATHGLEKTGEFPLASIRVNCLVYRVPKNVDLDRVVRNLARDKRVDLVQTNQVFESLETVTYGPGAIGVNSIRHVATGRGVLVAVIDTGADRTHPDLKGRLVKTENFVEGGKADFDRDRHGTAVTGIIAARANDKWGTYGVAPEAQIRVLKACWYARPTSPKASCSSWTLAKAVDSAIGAGSQIINLSLGGPFDALLGKLLSEADQRGVVVVAAAKETDQDPGFPASMRSVVRVVSSDVEGKVKHPSWQMDAHAIAAPGIDILTTVPGGKHAFLSGSSLAAAYVTGVIALLIQQQPDLTPSEIRTLITKSGFMGSTGSREVPQGITHLDACRAMAQLKIGLSCQ